MNMSDSERISTRLKQLRHKLAKDTTEANLIVVNFCSANQIAVDHALAELKKYKNKQLIVTGCLLPSDQKKLADKNITIWHPDDYFPIMPLRTNKFSAFVPIMTGCNNFCSYCVVPFTRGQEKSRPAKEIVNEIKRLIKSGTKEIILLGQSVSSYHGHYDRNSSSETLIKTGKFINFSQLLWLINALSGSFWISSNYLHPKDLSDEMITTMAKCKKFMPYLSLPMQSGDDKILCAMNRHYTVANYKKLISKLRTTFKKHRFPWPSLTISTDIIVGFPGETRQQFQNTIKLMKEIKFDKINFYFYSPRHGTLAAKLADKTTIQEKKQRAQTINRVFKRIADQSNKKYVNQITQVFIKNVGEKYAFGKTINNMEVILPARGVKCGQIIKVKITNATTWKLTKNLQNKQLPKGKQKYSVLLVAKIINTAEKRPR